MVCQLDAHYTWSKALDFTGAEAPLSGASTGIGFDPGARDLKNLKNNYHIAFTDIPHRFVVSMLYELPFGSGKHFGLHRALYSKGSLAAGGSALRKRFRAAIPFRSLAETMR